MKCRVHVPLLVGVCCLSLSAISCASSAYNWGNKVYFSPNEALAAQKQDFDSVLAQITPSQNPVSGSAVVITPSDELLLKRWAAPGANLKPTRAQTDYMLQCSGMWDRLYVEALRNRHLFDRTEWRQSADPDQERFDEDFAVVLAARDSKWVLRKKMQIGQSGTPIETGPVSLSLFQQTMIWLTRISEAARGTTRP